MHSLPFVDSGASLGAWRRLDLCEALTVCFLVAGQTAFCSEMATASSKFRNDTTFGAVSQAH